MTLLPKQAMVLCLGTLLPLLMVQPCFATGLDSSLTYVTVTFTDQATDYEPFAKDARICLRDSEKDQTLLNVLSPVARLDPVYRRGTPSYAVIGPWRVGLLNVSNAESVLAAIREDPHVAYAQLDSAAYSFVITDQAATWFPGQGTKPRFCDSQTQLHARRPGDLRAPTETWCEYEASNWNHDCDMDLPQAWAITMGDSNVVVAVVDIGTNWTHPGLGGPGPAQSVPDSLPYYNEGVIYRNWREAIGDANNDGYPGVQGVDDDGDGWIDEDSTLREPGEPREPDVLTGTVSSVQDTTITDTAAQYATNALVGLYLYGNHRDTPLYSEIVANTATTITARRVAVPGGMYLSWSLLTYAGQHYKTGNLLDDDDDDDIDDLGYLGDLTYDDDENGYNDDLRGYDFVNMPNASSFAQEDCIGQDNDPRSVGGHGTAIASQVSASSIAPMMGLAPLCKVLPIRAGIQSANVISQCGLGIVYDAECAAGMAYARQMGADIIVTATSSPGALSIAEAKRAARHGVLHCNGATPRLIQGEGPHDYAVCDSTILVAGLNDRDEKVARGSGDGVDIAARSQGLYVAEHTLTCPAGPLDEYEVESGTSLSGPIVAGVAALIKSAYPHWGLQDIRNKLLTSVDDIYTIPQDPLLNAPYEDGHQLGSGRVNAYKALTFYGPVGTVESDTTWTNTVWVSGDIEVPAGVTLTVAAGTAIKMAQSDIMERGQSAQRCEIHVRGTLLLQGTAQDSITIDIHRDDGTDHLWGPIVFADQAALARSTLSHVRFLNAVDPAYVVPAVAPVAVFVNRSDDTGLTFEGTPYAQVQLDYDGDQDKDLFVSVKDNTGKLFKNFELYDGVPSMQDVTESVFPLGNRPGTGLRGPSVCDINNDGAVDLFVAGESGARLYVNSGAPNWQFTDSLAASGLSSYVPNSWSGSWADYDGDARADLLVCTVPGSGTDPGPDMATGALYLLKNETWDGDVRFRDVTTSAFGSVPSGALISGTWGDLDNDGDLDLVLPDERVFSGLGTSALWCYLSNGDSTFTRVEMDRFVMWRPDEVQDIAAITLADCDNNGALDLCVAQNPPWGGGWVHFNNGGSYFRDRGPAYFDIGKTIDVRPLDHDLDGLVDMLFLPHAADQPVRLMLNRSTANPDSAVFFDVTSEVQLTGERADGAAVCDFNLDGDPDVFLGRPTTSGKFFYKTVQTGGSEAPANGWAGMRLIPSGANNEMSLGARVTVQVDTFTQAQVVDGGSGRGGQIDDRLVWGLGSLSGLITATTVWPNGESQLDTLTANTYTDVHDKSSPKVVAGTVTGQYIAKPGGKADWVFEWETEHACRPALDKVLISDGSNPPQCPVVGTLELDASYSGVVASVSPLPGGRYFHSLKWEDVDCAATCTYNYRVSSATDYVRSTSAQKQLKMKVCIQ